MGIGPFRSSSYCGCIKAKEEHRHDFGNPNPGNFQVLEVYDALPGACAVKIKYPDAKNYEGTKILVYQYTWEKVKMQSVLDPHFCDGPECVSPFARFEPSEKGWKLAKRLAAQLVGRSV